MASRLLLTCEHGGNRIPRECAALFRGAQKVLDSHRGYDPGALELARRFARELKAPLFAATTSRLVAELNRSSGHPRLFSEFTRPLDRAARERLLDRYYSPHRRAVEAAIAEHIAAGDVVVHVGVHTFTPNLAGEERRADVGLLYDPARPGEAAFCDAWRQKLAALDPQLAIRRNYPYRGAADGFTTALRRHFPAARYLGIELEVNQRWPAGSKAAWRALQSALTQSLGSVT